MGSVSVLIGLYVFVAIFIFIFGPRLEPPDSVNTFEDYLSWRPRTEEIFELTLNEGDYLLVFGPERGIMASVPSAYIFDERGILFDWTVDSGDDPEFLRRWPYTQHNSRGVGLHEARKLMGAGRKPR